MTNNFKDDLRLGQKYELEFIKYINYEKYSISEGVFKPYDILFESGHKTLKVEVKTDRLASKTDNICIEYECSKIKSGISTTESDYYAYFILHSNGKNYDLYYIPTKQIKENIKMKKYKFTVNGGDNKSSKMYLFNINVFNKYKIDKKSKFNIN